MTAGHPSTHMFEPRTWFSSQQLLISTSVHLSNHNLPLVPLALPLHFLDPVPPVQVPAFRGTPPDLPHLPLPGFVPAFTVFGLHVFFLEDPEDEFVSSAVLWDYE